MAFERSILLVSFGVMASCSQATMSNGAMPIDVTQVEGGGDASLDGGAVDVADAGAARLDTVDVADTSAARLDAVDALGADAPRADAFDAITTDVPPDGARVDTLDVFAADAPSDGSRPDATDAIPSDGPADVGAPDAALDLVVEIAAGSGHTCARRTSGAVVCWGAGDSGQLGDGTTAPTRATFTRVAGLTDAVEIAAGAQHTCARRAGGTVVCWGLNETGQLGDGTRRNLSSTFVAVAGLTDAVEIAAGSGHTCARRASGAVVCWGANSAGALGDGTNTERDTFVTVLGLSDAVEIAAGSAHTCARRASGGVACWGWNRFGQLGVGTTADVAAWLPVAELTDAVEITVGYFHTCARRMSGAVACWGANDFGQLGDGTRTNRTTPVPVPGVIDASEIVGGDHSTCVRRASGLVVCAGLNHRGQLGDGTTTLRTSVVPVVGLNDAAQIVLGGDRYTTSGLGSQTCARRVRGAVVCWGANNRGQVGDGTLIDRWEPVTVRGL